LQAFFNRRFPQLLGLGLSLALFATAVALLDRPFGSAPPLGRFFSPIAGAWAGRGRDLWGKSGRLAIPGLKGSVAVRVDREGVKRLFAESDDDLYFAQGFVVASDRLWQMDFIYRLAAGRLAEVMGPRALAYDKLFRRFGLPQAAEESAEMMLQDSATKGPLTAYASGVNAYIATLEPASYPLEYKLLNYAPEKWSPRHAAYIMKFMAYNLAAHSGDLPLTRSQGRVSQEDFDDLFPLNMPVPEPIAPKGTKWGFGSLAPDPPREFRANIGALEPLPAPNPANGSNNWAVAGKKSVTGRPILSNDIHLEYSLPSLWYEIQLSSPTQNVYGASLPGAPGIVLGFNQRLAWATTNGGDDVLDWYELRFRDEKRSEYFHEGEWRPVVKSEATIKVKGQDPVTLSLRRTHFGPIVYDEAEAPAAAWIPRGLAMRWAPLEASNEVRAFLALNRAGSIEACHEALAHFNWPAQNFLCADKKSIGLWHAGLFPIRWRGQGRTVSDGSSRDFDWFGWVPRDQIPSSVNPERGFLSSANQAPAELSYPHYLGWPFEEPYRGRRINQALRGKEKLAPEDLIALQGDVESALARDALPALMEALPGANGMSERQREIAQALAKWNQRFEAESIGASIFGAWWENFEDAVWSEKFPDRALFSYPPAWRTVALLSDPKSRHFDQLSTPERETLRDRAWSSFQKTERDLALRLGDRVGDWSLANARPTSIPHAGHIPGLGREKMAVGGGRFSVFANTGWHGPVWKLVVALGGTDPGVEGAPRAWAIYPGGQSGDPASPQYDEFIDRWARNELREVRFLASASAPLQDEVATVNLEGK
jgi:penicillin amidase